MKNNIKFYFFTEKLNDLITKNIIKFKKICIIYKPNNINNNDHSEIINIKKFCKKNNILFLISDNLKLTFKYKADGIFLSSWNKRVLNLYSCQKNFHIIGSAHNMNEYYFKIIQKCQTVMLSPIFYNKKYTTNKILEVIKFNLITLNWKKRICALGGINLNNLQKIKITNASSIAFVTLISAYNTKSLPMISMSRLFKTKLL